MATLHLLYYILSHEGSLLFSLCLKIFQNIVTHFYPHLVNQMYLILVSLASSPLVPPVGLELNLPALHHLLMGPNAKGMKPRYQVDPISAVEGLDPLIDASDLIPPVHIGRGSGPIVREPKKLRSRD